MWNLNSHILQVEYKMVSHFRKQFQFLIKISTHLTEDPAITLLGIYSRRKKKIQTKTCTLMFL